VKLIDWNDFWFSLNGSNCTKVRSAAEWSRRTRHTVVYKESKLWLLGGYFDNDVWCSFNGITWHLIVDNASYTPSWLPKIIHNNRIWSINGVNREAWFSVESVAKQGSLYLYQKN